MTNSMLRMRRLFISILALSAVTAALAAPTQTQTANAAGPVTQVIVWGDSMSLAWGAFLEPLLGVPVIRNGVGSEDVQQTEVRFNRWVAANGSKLATTGHLCWCGHVNNNSEHEGTAKDIDTIVPTLLRMGAKVPLGLFMPIGLTNGPLAPGPNGSTAASTEYLRTINDVTGTTVTAVNEIMAAPRPLGFGASYAEVRRYLVTDGLRLQGITATATDNANIAVDVPPRSLRRDAEDPDTDAHLNDAGKRVTASRLNDLIRAAGWIAAAAVGRATSTSVSATPNPSAQGAQIRATARVTETVTDPRTPTGKVQFFVSGAVLGQPVTLRADGTAKSPYFRIQTAGAHAIEARYTGDTVFAGSSSPSYTQNVTATTTLYASALTITSSLNPSPAATRVRFTATVTDASGQAGTLKPTGIVWFWLDGVPIGTAPATVNQFGAASTPLIRIAAGYHQITAAYYGDSRFAFTTAPPFTQTMT